MWIYEIYLDGLARRLQNSPEKSTAMYVWLSILLPLLNLPSQT